MYSGHVAIALGAHGLRREVPLAILVAAAQGADWVQLLSAPFGTRVESALWSHALPWVLIGGLAAAVLTWWWTGSVVSAVVVCTVYLSHPIADYLTGFKALWIGGPRVGLLLIERPAIDFAVQAALDMIGWGLYWRSLPPLRRRQASCLLPLLLLLSLQGLADLVLAS